MTQARFTTCFISAPFGADTSVLRSVLDERGIGWIDQTIVEPGRNWLEAMDTALTRSDFVCVILPEGQHGNILFELGIAYARRKPILAFLTSSSTLPSDILSLTYVRVDPRDRTAVQSALGTFLEHATEKRTWRTQKGPAKAVLPSKEPLPFPPSGAPEFEQRTAKLLQEAGFIVSWPTERRDKGADFAVWIDEVEHSLGNPLLVEVKAGLLSVQQIRQAASRLRASVAKTHGRSGLLVYWDQHNREYPLVSSDWPLIFQLSGTALAQLVQEGRLPKELIRLRNAAVHGEV